MNVHLNERRENSAILISNPLLLYLTAHADQGVRNLVNKRLPHFRRQLDLALDRVLVEQTDKIRGDLQRMEPKLGTVSGGGKLGNELKRERQSASRLTGGRAEA